MVREAKLGAAVEERRVELVVVRTQLEKQFQHLVVHPLGAGGVAVDLVDDADGLEAVAKRLAQHPARLRLRPAHGIGQQQHAIDHLHHALHLGAEVGVAGRVHDVDLVAIPFDGRVFGLDGDALFALEIHRIHDPLNDNLVVTKRAALPQQLIHERGLAVVHVRNNCDISNFVCFH